MKKRLVRIPSLSEQRKQAWKGSNLIHGPGNLNTRLRVFLSPELWAILVRGDRLSILQLQSLGQLTDCLGLRSRQFVRKSPECVVVHIERASNPSHPPWLLLKSSTL